MRKLLFIILIFALSACQQSVKDELVVEQKIPVRSNIPLVHQIPKSWTKCRQYWKPIFQATARYGDQNDSPFMYMAQFRQESHCKPDAESHVGARGVGQIMPATHKEIEKKWDQGPFDAWDAGMNIQASLWYDNKYIRRMWNPKYRTFCSRVMLMYSGYNSGNGWWLKAQKLCIKETGRDCNDYYDMAQFFPIVNPIGAEENLHYVKRISQNWLKIQSVEQGACREYDATHFLPK